MTENLVIAIVGGCIGCLQGLILYILNQQNKKLSSICEDNSKAHDEIYDRIHHHKHTEKGEVVIV